MLDKVDVVTASEYLDEKNVKCLLIKCDQAIRLDEKNLNCLLIEYDQVIRLDEKNVKCLVSRTFPDEHGVVRNVELRVHPRQDCIESFIKEHTASYTGSSSTLTIVSTLFPIAETIQRYSPNKQINNM